MAKAVFRPAELTVIKDRVVIESPVLSPALMLETVAEETPEAAQAVEEYTGPTAEDLRREAEDFRSQWEEEKQKMMDDAEAQAKNIVSEAKEAAFNEIKRKTDEAQVIKAQAQAEAENIIADAQSKAVEIESEARKSLKNDRMEAQQKGREEGLKNGFADGQAEVERLIGRTQTVLERAQDKRAEILSDTEQEIIDLVLLITRKVVKVISENQRNVIVSNVVQALKKIKAKGNIIIRVNTADLNMATENKQKFIQLLEGVKSIQVAEDSSVDSGGCIIETDFGEIDARISSQLAELENKILDISPIKAKQKNGIPAPNGVPAKLNGNAPSAVAREAI